jgi:Tetracyclin repressor-like, C-terminal domain
VASSPTRRWARAAVQVADHLLGVAFRDNPDGDATVLEETELVLRRYLGV